jgi:anthranilate synthase/aminodeoxychorismate synthase-like glutamine amidotransferase
MLQKVLLIDNRDSFTWNLAQLFEETELCELSVTRNDEISVEMAEWYDKFVISPGPGVPSEIPILKTFIDHFAGKKSILGICLGHQAIIESLGGTLFNLPEVVHGQLQKIEVLQPVDQIFDGMPCVFKAGLYHSWAAETDILPDCLRVTAIGPGGVIMAVSHRTYDLKGIQFHPESYMTEAGSRIIENWLRF